MRRKPTSIGVNQMKIGVIGVTGLVGTDILRILEQRKTPVSELRGFASERSVGRKVPFAGGEVICQLLEPGCFDGLDAVVVDVDDPISLEWAPQAAAAGCVVIDNSAAFRMDPDVPLVVAEVNPDDLADLPKGIASCPNCTTMVLMVALGPLHAVNPIKRLVVSTYQSVSGAGQAGLHELRDQWRANADDLDWMATAGESTVPTGEVWPIQIAGNAIPLAGSVKEAGYTSEEWKLVRETRKILHDDDIQVSATCVRVPVFVGHAMTANIEFERPMSRDEAISLLENAPGLILDADGAPTPLEAAGIDPVLVGRIREDVSRPGALDLWVTGDNLRKGAALNAVQMLEVAMAQREVVSNS